MKKCIAAALAAGLMVASGSPAWAQADDLAQRRALTLQYIEVVNLMKIMDTLSKSMTSSLVRGSQLPPNVGTALQDAASEGMAAIMPRMMDEMVDLYARKFTTEELTALVNFYSSPAGRSITAKTEELSAQTTPMMLKYAPIMQREILTRLCGKVECPAQLKDMVKTLGAGA